MPSFGTNIQPTSSIKNAQFKEDVNNGTKRMARMTAYVKKLEERFASGEPLSEMEKVVADMCIEHGVNTMSMR